MLFVYKIFLKFLENFFLTCLLEFRTFNIHAHAFKLIVTLGSAK